MGNAMKTIMVSGGSGLLGGNCLMMLKGGCRVVGLYHTHKVELPGVEMWSVDLRDFAAVAAMIDKMRPDVFIHCAALTDVDYCEAHPQEAMQMNADVVGGIAGLARQHDLRFVHISTDAVYDALHGDSSEVAPVSPVNVYASTKLAGEQAALSENPGSLIIRACIYGWNARNKLSFSETILKALLLGEKITLFHDVFFSPILVNDLVEAVFGLLLGGRSGIYNVGASQGISKFAFGKMIAEISGLSPDPICSISLTEKKLTAARPRNPVMNVAKVQGALQRPMPTVEQGLARFMGLLDGGYVNNIKPGVA